MNDQYVIPIFIAVTILLVVFAFFIVFFVIVHKQKQNANELEKQKMIFDHKNKLLTARIEEQERVMSQISKEVHDNVGQILNFHMMNMRVIGKLATDEEQIDLIKNSSSVLTGLIATVNNISHSLNSDYVKGRGLFDILKNELKYLSASNDIRCEINARGEHKILTPEEELIVYRIAQEVIHNAMKHARANCITIDLSYECEKFVLIISDNGVGFKRDKIFALDGIGFLNMYQRAKFLNGKLDISSAPSEGCTISLEVSRLQEA